MGGVNAVAFAQGGSQSVLVQPSFSDPIGPPPLAIPTTITSRKMASRGLVTPKYVIGGVTRDSTGAVLASCSVSLFQTSTNAVRGTTTSDLTGNYSFEVDDNTVTSFAVAYKAGSPDVEGTTVNTLVGA